LIVPIKYITLYFSNANEVVWTYNNVTYKIKKIDILGKVDIAVRLPVYPDIPKRKFIEVGNL